MKVWKNNIPFLRGRIISPLDWESETPFTSNTQQQLLLCKQQLIKGSIVCLQESYRQVMKMRPKDLWKRLMIKFRGEEGLDYGGVAR